ncbi:MAG: efflux RND transporter periplasmic adaptor subunit [Pseudomonadota bacterium]|nr:efflux RND transporter periplasmic adaptor subunit [Pseudomonadota bacterium]
MLILTLSPVWAQAQKYTCPMHPHYISTEMGTCPICGMDLVPMESSEEGDMEEDHSAHMSGNKRKSITIPPETIQNIGVRTEKAEAAHFGTHVRSFGLIKENMRLTHAISGRVAGWVEDLKITAIGDEVKQGDLLFTLYSPDLISAQQDYISSIATGVKGRMNSSAKRLKSLGVSQKAIDEIRVSRKKMEYLPFYAETDGIVSQLMVSQGSYIKPGMQIATIQNYSSVWIDVSVAEKDLQFLTKSSQATVTFPNLGNLERTAQVDYIHPTINVNSRTGQVRLVLDNVGGHLKPGAYADVQFETNIDKRLSIPSEAILKSSEGDFVVVALGGGKFQPQAVQTGIHNKGRTEVLSGLEEGEDVVVSSQFMIDSESSLRESFRKLESAQTPLALIDITQDQLSMIDHLVDAALYLHDAQANGFEADSKMLMPALKLNDHLLPQFRGTKLKFILQSAEEALNSANEAITETERDKALAELVKALKPWITEGKPKHYKDKGIKLYLDHGTGFYWLQLDGVMAHPYGAGHAVEVDLPDEVNAKVPVVTAPVGGAHAGH